MTDTDHLAPGDRLHRVTDHFGVSNIGPEVTVERVTPTGIAVLSNGARLKPQPNWALREARWEARGTGSTWRAPDRYYRADSEAVSEVKEEAWRRSARKRVHDAYSAMPKEFTADQLRHLIDESSETLADLMEMSR